MFLALLKSSVTLTDLRLAHQPLAGGPALFTDRKVPRERRARVPVVVAGGEIAWVPGVAAGERFGAGRPEASARVSLRWP